MNSIVRAMLMSVRFDTYIQVIIRCGYIYGLALHKCVIIDLEEFSSQVFHTECNWNNFIIIGDST